MHYSTVKKNYRKPLKFSLTIPSATILTRAVVLQCTQENRALTINQRPVLLININLIFNEVTAKLNENLLF